MSLKPTKADQSRPKPTVGFGRLRSDSVGFGCWGGPFYTPFPNSKIGKSIEKLNFYTLLPDFKIRKSVEKLNFSRNYFRYGEINFFTKTIPGVERL